MMPDLPSWATEHMGVGESPTQQELAGAARRLVDASGLYLGQNRILRLALKFRAYQPTGDTTAFLRWFANEVNLNAEQRRRAARSNPEIARVISYRDPVGEDAVNNVLQGRSVTDDTP
jgi:hypothetical protein